MQRLDCTRALELSQARPHYKCHCSTSTACVCVVLCALYIKLENSLCVQGERSCTSFLQRIMHAVHTPPLDELLPLLLSLLLLLLPRPLLPPLLLSLSQASIMPSCLTRC